MALKKAFLGSIPDTTPWWQDRKPTNEESDWKTVTKYIQNKMIVLLRRAAHMLENGRGGFRHEF